MNPAAKVPEKLHFPTEDRILFFLKEHSLTKDPYLSELNVISATSKCFANLEIQATEVVSRVITLWDELKIDFEPNVAKLVQKCLVKALIDCGAGRKIILTHFKVKRS